MSEMPKRWEYFAWSDREYNGAFDAFHANDPYIDYLEKEIEKPFSEQIRAKDKWINELLLENKELKSEM